ncbi:NAD-dependent succinate-semialdehyde dehydrogenase [Tumebacillus sp. ITR2]|uniref:NAD-dependent succinate-semialdehyde dehydrogenase n=1 Tax=Tumebacillus amylolyticus TaxID=2801339 RepID=A0ABS1J793_9BACL|nr:NAD-dependent succinate-semialdehyde dehydrogenase [Tumebacillus amylolyticus]MBL0386129.1 NAD-dependent succinate-semialdehyde dehydrogenase [Tumebacillus amylolyticus]
MTTTSKLYINGEWIATDSTFEVTDPATGQVVGYAADADVSHADAAIDAAHKAFPAWAATPAHKRSQMLYKWYNLIMEQRNELAAILTGEMGKPLMEAKGELINAAGFVQWYAEEAKRVHGETIPHLEPTKRITVLKQPVGVVSAITPWNFPAGMITRKVAPALAAGCTIVLKPAEQTPLTAVRLIELAEQAGFPAGVINLITTSKPAEVGTMLTTDKRVRKVTFTGSTEVGKLIARNAADTVKRVSLELGGHAPFIVFDDADIKKAVFGLINSKYRNAGQTCICTNRVYVHKNIAEEFVKAAAEEVQKQFKLGHGLEKETTMGPLIDQQALDKATLHVEDAVSKGATVVTGGKRHGEQGYFFEPTLLSGVTEEMRIATEETFGPVAPVFTFETEQEVLARANNSDYGLAAYVYTNDLGRSIRMSEGLEYGIVGVNDPMPANAVQAPFGGMKQSGLGREGGHYGMEPFLEVKYISTGF